MAKVRVFLALQEFSNGEVNFRRWSPDCPRNIPGGPYEKQTIDAHLWLQRMVFRCARDGLTPIVKWQETIHATDDFLKTVPPFSVLEIPDTEETQFLGNFRGNGFAQARFVEGYPT